jgi:hypothetical protein
MKENRYENVYHENLLGIAADIIVFSTVWENNFLPYDSSLDLLYDYA